MATSKNQPPAQDSEWGEEISGGSLITWNEPKTVIGKLIDLIEVPGGKYGDKYKATLVQDDGSTIATFPPSMLLARLQQVNLGTRIRIDYAGTTVKSKSGRDVKEFVVRPARDNAAAATDVFGAGSAGSGVRV